MSAHSHINFKSLCIKKTKTSIYNKVTLHKVIWTIFYIGHIIWYNSRWIKLKSTLIWDSECEFYINIYFKIHTGKYSWQSYSKEKLNLFNSSSSSNLPVIGYSNELIPLWLWNALWLKKFFKIRKFYTFSE